MKKPSLLENKQLEEEKEDFQEVLGFLKIYKPIEYKPNEELIKKRNYILSPQAKNRLSLLNHYITNGIHLILEGPTGTSKTLRNDILESIIFKEKPKKQNVNQNKSNMISSSGLDIGNIMYNKKYAEEFSNDFYVPNRPKDIEQKNFEKKEDIKINSLVEENNLVKINLQNDKKKIYLIFKKQLQM